MSVPYRHIEEHAIARFWALVDKRGPAECWPWLGTLWDRNSNFLYGVASWKGKRHKAHRLAEAHGVHKLTQVQVNEIQTAATGYGTGRALARKYGVSPSTVSAIRKGKSWVQLEVKST